MFPILTLCLVLRCKIRMMGDFLLYRYIGYIVAWMSSWDYVLCHGSLTPALLICHWAEDDELITNMLETLVNLAPVLDLRIFSSSKPSFIKMTWEWDLILKLDYPLLFFPILKLTHLPSFGQDSEKGAVHAIMGMLSSSVKPWHCAAAELIGRLIINPDNESFLLPVIPQVHAVYVTVFIW